MIENSKMIRKLILINKSKINKMVYLILGMMIIKKSVINNQIICYKETHSFLIQIILAIQIRRDLGICQNYINLKITSTNLSREIS